MKRLLSSLLHRPKAGLPSPQNDPTFGDPKALRLQEFLKRGSWREVVDLIRGERSWQSRAFLVGIASDHPGRPAWLDAWVYEHPDESDGYLVRGDHGIQWAWEARTSHRAENVTDEGWRLFFDRLQFAYQDLEAAAQRDEEDPTPWACMVTCVMAGQQGTDEGLFHLRQALARDPLHYDAHNRMQHFLAEKWFGSHQEMHEFARQSAAMAPPGHRLYDLIPVACLAQYEYLRDFDESPEEAHAYITSPAVRKRVDAAARARFSTDAEPAWSNVLSHNTFGGFYHAVDDEERLAHHLRAMRGLYSEFPWYFWSRNVHGLMQTLHKRLGR